jgi:hypothetical protein
MVIVSLVESRSIVSDFAPFGATLIRRRFALFGATLIRQRFCPEGATLIRQRFALFGATLIRQRFCPEGATTQSPELPLRLLWEGGADGINRNAVASLGCS